MSSQTLVWSDAVNNEISVDIEATGSVWAPTEYARSLGSLLAVQPLDGLKVLDLGCGSGVLGILAARLGAVVTCSDLNPDAIDCAMKNARTNSVSIDGVVADGLRDFIERGRCFDLIVSNPPSIPGQPGMIRTEKEDWCRDGPEGRHLLNSLLVEGSRSINTDGRLLFCSSSEQRWLKTQSLLTEYWGCFRTVKRAEFELTGSLYAPHITGWLSDGRAWKRGGKPFHEVRFVFAYQ